MPGDDNIFHQYKDHNPYWKARGPAYNERRHQLFWTARRRIPGTVSKLSLACLFTCFFYGVYSFKKARTERDRGRMILYEYKRKSIPFLQAIEDRRFLASEKRKEWLVDALFEDKEEMLALKRLYNDPTAYPGPQTPGHWHYGGTQRSYKAAWGQFQDWSYGNDAYRRNIPSAHF
ncbi:unnamed protein product [Blepharisma stoltei]|uniref:NADH dehydrogenase [ubiquinone] 1 beta subcomplex subunit 4 n=1 Tax=Blepharisma stoltei TaxID=1481888 RepID=A0AAU9JJQ3_9CILI|nr:unnamed protein product [Blepharisma stoltei]